MCRNRRPYCLKGSANRDQSGVLEEAYGKVSQQSRHIGIEEPYSHISAPMAAISRATVEFGGLDKPEHVGLARRLEGGLGNFVWTDHGYAEPREFVASMHGLRVCCKRGLMSFSAP